jgi:hypothetical protein
MIGHPLFFLSFARRHFSNQQSEANSQTLRIFFLPLSFFFFYNFFGKKINLCISGILDKLNLAMVVWF